MHILTIDIHFTFGLDEIMDSKNIKHQECTSEAVLIIFDPHVTYVSSRVILYGR